MGLGGGIGAGMKGGKLGRPKRTRRSDLWTVRTIGGLSDLIGVGDRCLDS